jgi:argininosuccinate lyase
MRFGTAICALALTLAAGAAQAQGPAAQDEYFWLSQMNKAANVVLLENGVIDAGVARNNAAAIRKLDAAMQAPGARRTGDYKLVEPMLIEIGGYDVSTLHSGRSRVDIVATSRRLLQREEILAAMEKLNRARRSILAFGVEHKRALVPVYTQGRQSAGVPVGHYITAYTASLDVEAENLRQAYALINRSPLGAGAVATSSFPLDRRRLSDLLGFAAPLENSLFANELSIINGGAKIVGATTSGAQVIGTLASDLELQYARTYPWFTVREDEGGLTSRSSSMPHKVNPSILNDVRQQASLVVGMGATYTIRSHNVQHGMPDSKRGEPDEALALYGRMMDQVVSLFDNLAFDEAAARAEVELEYAATPELADTLQREAKVPFRVGHEFSSAVVDYGKAHHLRPAEFPFEVAQSLYAEVAAKAGVEPRRLPLSPEGFRKAMSAANMVAVAQGLGGPQPAEVDRMLAAAGAAIDADQRWIEQQRAGLALASRRLDQAFARTAQ